MSRRQPTQAGEHDSRSTQHGQPRKIRRIHPRKPSTLPPKMQPSHPCFFLVAQFGEVFDIDGNFSAELYLEHLREQGYSVYQ
jgi:hypothetical protein